MAEERYKISADWNRLPAPDFQIRQMVMVKAKYIRTTQPSRKLGPKNQGPFKIIAQPGPISFTLELPLGLHGIHPDFHTSMLEPITLNSILNRTQDPLPPVEIEGKPEFIVETILDSKIDCCRTCPLQYFVKWEGYEGTPEETSWTDASLCENAPDLIEEFHRCYPNKPGPLAKLKKPKKPRFLLSLHYTHSLSLKVFIQVQSDFTLVHSNSSDSNYTFKKSILLLH